MKNCKGCQLGPHHTLHQPGFPPDLQSFARRYVGQGGYFKDNIDILVSSINSGSAGYGDAYGGDGFHTRKGKITVTCHGTVIATWSSLQIATAYINDNLQPPLIPPG